MRAPFLPFRVMDSSLARFVLSSAKPFGMTLSWQSRRSTASTRLVRLAPPNIAPVWRLSARSCGRLALRLALIAALVGLRLPLIAGLKESRLSWLKGLALRGVCLLKSSTGCPLSSSGLILSSRGAVAQMYLVLPPS